MPPLPAPGAMPGDWNNFFRGMKDDTDLVQNADDRQKQLESGRKFKDGKPVPKLEKAIQKPSKKAIQEKRDKTRGAANLSVGERLAKMVETGIRVEPCADQKAFFQHDARLERCAKDWRGIIQWQREAYGKEPDVCEGKQWFRQLPGAEKEALRECCRAGVLDKYSDKGIKFHSTHGHFFHHAGGGITLLGKDPIECPCGATHSAFL